MRVFIVTTEYATGNSGGVESVTHFLVASIQRMTDWEVEVASLRMSRRASESRSLLRPASWLPSRRTSIRELENVRVHNIGSSWAEVEPVRFLPRRWLDDLLASSDVVVVVSGTPATCNAVRRLRLPVLLQVATLATLERRSKNAQLSGAAAIYRRLTTWVTGRLDETGLKVPSHVLVENARMLEECQTRGARKVSLCPPGVDTAVFRPSATRRAGAYILMVGRLGDPRKNLGGLIRAFALSRKLYNLSHVLVLAGLTSPSEEHLRLIDELGIGEFVRVHSPVAEEALVDLYQGADLFASTSFEEGLGLTFVEAMACGVPVVTSNTDGASFVLGDSTAGSLVDFGPKFTERFAKELSLWCSDAQRRMNAGASGRKRVLEALSADVSAANFIEAIREAVVNG